MGNNYRGELTLSLAAHQEFEKNKLTTLSSIPNTGL